MGLSMSLSKVHVDAHLHENAVSVSSYSKHWPCLLPQHGPGVKHNRSIVLADWQSEVTALHPWRLLRGLIHSDGCRFVNPVTKPGRTRVYEYARYCFSNRSADIRRIFCEHCDLVGVEWRRMNEFNISIARRRSGELMDRFIGPKS